MKIKINKNELIEKLTLLSTLVKENKIRPVISQVLITVEKETQLTGTDLEKSLICNLESEVLEIGKAMLGLDILDFIKLIDEENIVIETIGNILKIDNAEFSMLDYEEYPRINIQEEKYKEIKSKDLANNIRKVMFASSQDLSNMAIAGVRIDGNNIAASDTYRLCKVVQEEELDMITVPTDTLKTALKILDNNDDVKIYTGKDFRIATDEILFVSRSIDLSFPDYESIMNNVTENATNEINVNTKELTKVLKKVNTFSNKNIESKNSALFEIKNNKITIKATNDKSKIKEVIECININKIELKISLNCKFILEYLNVIDKETTCIFFKDNSSPVMINKDYVIMPVATREE